MTPWVLKLTRHPAISTYITAAAYGGVKVGNKTVTMCSFPTTGTREQMTWQPC